MAPADSSPPADCESGLALGLLLTVAGAALLALSMVTQRYALGHPQPRIPCCVCALPRDLVWFFGLVVYAAANALKIVAQPYGPWSVLSSVWSTLLVFNLVFARVLLKEAITPPKAIGSLVILAGGVLCVLGSQLGWQMIRLLLAV